MEYCSRCNMPSTRPGSIFIDGVCGACYNFDTRKSIDWNQRKQEFYGFCYKYKNRAGPYDCVIPVSGGKDSHVLVYYLRKEIGMNPLLVNVSDPFTKTKAGEVNLRNLCDTFNCDLMVFNIGLDTFRRATRIAFENTGEALKFVETAIYTIPFKIMVSMNIPFMVYGEDSAFLYGPSDVERKFANDYIMEVFDGFDPSFWISNGLEQENLNSCMKPSVEDIERVSPCVLFMSYFIPWSSNDNLRIARRFGFRDLYHEWQREGYIDHYEQIDSVAYMVHHWLKYPKFGFNRPVDVISRYIREGLITLEKGKQLMENHWKIDQRALDDFCEFCGYTIPEFWSVVDSLWDNGLGDTHYFKFMDYGLFKCLKYTQEG